MVTNYVWGLFAEVKIHCLYSFSGVRKRIGRSLRGDGSATLCKNMVNIGLVTSEFKKGVCGNFAVTRLQTDDHNRLYTRQTGVLKRIRTSQFRLHRVNQQ